MPLPPTLRAADDELRAIAAMLQSLDPVDFARRTTCPDWDVAALAHHVVSVAWRQAEAFHRARLGSVEAPSPLAVGADARPAEVAAFLHACADHLTEAVRAMGERPWPSIPLPFAVLPAPVAASVLVLEYGVHRYDLASALGFADAELSEVGAAAVLDLAAGLLSIVAQPGGEQPLAFRFAAPSTTIDAGWDGRAWTSAVPGGAPVCTFAGDDATIALLLMRRISATDPALDTDDPDGLANRYDALIGGI